MCMELWLKTDETEEAISALEMLADILQSLVANKYRWKWAIIATHNALQGFMVLALRQGNSLLTLKDNIAKKWLSVYRDGGEYPEEKLDYFLNLYKKVKSDDMLCYVQSKKFKATPSHDNCIKEINEIRNKFIHFIPKCLYLELAGLPEICICCLEIIEFLSWESGNIIFYEDEQQKRVMLALKKANEELNNIKKNYEEASNKVNTNDI